MRTLLAIAALLLLVAPGCGDDTTSPAGNDLSQGMDLSAAAGDMSKLNCSQLLTCAGGCTTQACVLQCAGNATTAAQQAALALSTCLGAACLAVDGGSGMCTSVTDNSNPCKACQATAAQGRCMTQYTTCTSM